MRGAGTARGQQDFRGHLAPAVPSIAPHTLAPQQDDSLPSAEAALILHRKGFDCSLEAKNLGFNCTTSQGKVRPGCDLQPPLGQSQAGAPARLAPHLTPVLMPSQDGGWRGPPCPPAPVSQNRWLVKSPTVQHAALLCPLPRQSWRMLVFHEAGLEPSTSLAFPSEEGQSLGWAGSAWCPGCRGGPANWLLAQRVWGCPVHSAALPPTLLPPLSLAGPGQPVPGAGAGLPAAHLADLDVPTGHGL